MLENIITKECERRGVPFDKKYLRRAKAQFNSLPWHRKETFTVRDLK